MGETAIVESKISEVERRLALLEDKSNTGGHNMDMAGYSDGREEPVETSSVLSRIKALESSVGGSSFEVHGMSFGSIEELELWVEEEKILSCGFFVDLFSALVGMMQESRQTGKERADSNYSSKRTNTTRFEDKLVASMGHDLPGCFFKVDEGTGTFVKEEGFSLCKTYKQWIGSNGVKGYKNVLLDKLKNYLAGVRGAISRFIGGWADKARLLLSDVETQYLALSGFVEQFQIELTSVSNFSESRAWALVGRCVGAVFETQVRIRSETVLLEDTSRLGSKAKIIGTVLQCHRMFEEFRDLNFRAHPAIVKELSLFMLTERVDPIEVVKLRGELTIAREEAKGAKADVAKAVAENAKLKNQLTNVVEDIRKLKERVSKTEKK
jgi:hypothetical protein